MENKQPELRYKDGTPMRKYNSPKLQELEQINQDNPITRGSTALVYKQETLEEAALRLFPKFISDPYNPSEDLNKYERDIWIEGAKWQQERMYSEEDLLSAFEAGMMFIGEDKGSFKEWFEQFKKK